MTDDKLLLSAFKKLLAEGDHVVFDDGKKGPPLNDIEPFLEIDGYATLTADEARAVERFCSPDEADRESDPRCGSAVDDEVGRKHHCTLKPGHRGGHEEWPADGGPIRGWNK